MNEEGRGVKMKGRECGRRRESNEEGKGTKEKGTVVRMKECVNKE